MRDHVIRAIINITRDHADIVPLLQGKALKIAMIDRDGIGMKSLERDPREPGLKRKQAAERKIKAFMNKVFERQAESVRMQLSGYFPATKAKTPPVQIDWTDDERDELISLYSGVMDDGAQAIEMLGVLDVGDHPEGAGHHLAIEDPDRPGRRRLAER